MSITGTHLSKIHGNTLIEIFKDKIKVNSKIKILQKGDLNNDISTSFSNAVTKYSELLEKIKPDLILILGDRFEIMAVAIASTLHRIPIAHLHGGEETSGAIDDVMRHSITKMSHIHFTSTQEYKSRVIQMGENPKLVFNVGAVGLENLKDIKFKNEHFFKDKYKINFKKNTIMICFHPETISPGLEKKHINEILKSLTHRKNCNLIFSSPNADQGHKTIISAIKSFVKKNNNAYYIQSFGREEFLSCLKLSNVILGNSSSGIIEAPSLRTLTINVGDRQKGRIQANSILNCKIKKYDMENLLNKILNKRLKASKNLFNNPYYKKNCLRNITKNLEKLDYKQIIKKKFFKLKQY